MIFLESKVLLTFNLAWNSKNRLKLLSTYPGGGLKVS